MADRSAIAWTESTWNPTTGCSKLSPGCAHCYAEIVTAKYAGRDGWPARHLPWTPDNAAENVRLHPARLSTPLRWTTPRRVFVNSMSDLFHAEIPFTYVAAVFGVMAACPWHTFQVLTKRPERALRFFEWLQDEVWGTDGQAVSSILQQYAAAELGAAYPLPATGTGAPWPLPNVWMGVSIENRRYVNRADILREIPAVTRFISAEPLLGPLVYDAHEPAFVYESGDPTVAPVTGTLQSVRAPRWADDYDGQQLDLVDIDWLIAGGESGPRHRTMSLDAVADLHSACQLTAGGTHPAGDWHGTAFFAKQDSGARAGQQGRIPDEVWVQEWPTPKYTTLAYGQNWSDLHAT